MAISPNKAKELSKLANECFERMVGNPPNHNFKFNNRDEVLFVFGIIETMVIGYANKMPGNEPVDGFRC